MRIVNRCFFCCFKWSSGNPAFFWVYFIFQKAFEIRSEKSRSDGVTLALKGPVMSLISGCSPGFPMAHAYSINTSFSIAQKNRLKSQKIDDTRFKMNVAVYFLSCFALVNGSRLWPAKTRALRCWYSKIAVPLPSIFEGQVRFGKPTNFLLSKNPWSTQHLIDCFSIFALYTNKLRTDRLRIIKNRLHDMYKNSS